MNTTLPASGSAKRLRRRRRSWTSTRKSASLLGQSSSCSRCRRCRTTRPDDCAKSKKKCPHHSPPLWWAVPPASTLSYLGLRLAGHRHCFLPRLPLLTFVRLVGSLAQDSATGSVLISKLPSANFSSLAARMPIRHNHLYPRGPCGAAIPWPKSQGFFLAPGTQAVLRATGLLPSRAARPMPYLEAFPFGEERVPMFPARPRTQWLAPSREHLLQLRDALHARCRRDRVRSPECLLLRRWSAARAIQREQQPLRAKHVEDVRDRRGMAIETPTTTLRTERGKARPDRCDMPHPDVRHRFRFCPSAGDGFRWTISCGRER